VEAEFVRTLPKKITPALAVSTAAYTLAIRTGSTNCSPFGCRYRSNAVITFSWLWFSLTRNSPCIVITFVQSSFSQPGFTPFVNSFDEGEYICGEFILFHQRVVQLGFIQSSLPQEIPIHPLRLVVRACVDFSASVCLVYCKITRSKLVSVQSMQSVQAIKTSQPLLGLLSPSLTLTQAAVLILQPV
jgi:hypothetical protein